MKFRTYNLEHNWRVRDLEQLQAAFEGNLKHPLKTLGLTNPAQHMIEQAQAVVERASRFVIPETEDIYAFIDNLQRMYDRVNHDSFWGGAVEIVMQDEYYSETTNPADFFIALYWINAHVNNSRLNKKIEGWYRPGPITSFETDMDEKNGCTREVYDNLLPLFGRNDGRVD